MNSPLPESCTYVVVGAGVHGLSTAWHLAMELQNRGKGSGSDIVLLDKTGPGAGATGVACGCVRNFYMTGPLHAILRESVDVWTYDPVKLGFQQVGYVSAGEDNQTADYERIHKSQNAAGYPSDLYVGTDARRFLKSIWPDFKTDQVDVVLHELPSGYAGTSQVVWGLDQFCQQYGVNRHYGVEVTGYEKTNGRVTAVKTTQGSIKCDAVVLAAGAWNPKHWAWLGHAPTLDLHYPDGGVINGQDMWTYWRLLEGEVYIHEPYRTADDRDPPVLHVELMNTPVLDPQSGGELGDHMYAYVRYAKERMDKPGVQGGTIPVKLGPEAVVDPYGHANDEYQAEPWFADYYCAALGQLMSRFEDCRRDFRERRNGGIGAFTPDNVPIFDWIDDNVYMVADSNHGFKMIGVGKLLAHHLATGESVAELAPFSLDRYATGKSFGDRNSNCPWV